MVGLGGAYFLPTHPNSKVGLRIGGSYERMGHVG